MVNVARTPPSVHCSQLVSSHGGCRLPNQCRCSLHRAKTWVLCLSRLIIITSSASPEGGRDAGLQVHSERRARFRASSTVKLPSNLPFESTSLGNFVLQPYQLLSSKMAPRCPGGRPRNEWNSSRSRKLVRLYTLTRLSKEDIQKVLAAEDFNPW
jgi:hypothetical protein